MPQHLLYGVALSSNMVIPGLLPLPDDHVAKSQVHLKMAELPPWLTQTPESYHSAPMMYVTPDRNEQGNFNLRVWQINQGQHFYLRYCDDTVFFIDRQGTQIWATWPEDLTLEDTATYLLGPILGFVLRLRGTVCLHASAVAIENQVAVFVGEAGAGKSTTSAAFAQRGYPVLSDDVVALVDLGDTFLVQPAYPRIRLWDSSVQALYGAPDALPRIVPTHPTWDKRYLDLTQSGYQFQSEPLPLAAIYYLNHRSEEPTCPQIELIPYQSQLITLVANTYTNYLLDKQQRAQEFEVLSRLLDRIPIRQITAHSDVARLPKLLDAAIADFHAIVPSITAHA